MRIVQANISSIGHVVKLYLDVVSDLCKKGIYQWDDQYPNLGIILSDIKKNSLFVSVDTLLLGGAISINEEQEDEYGSIRWSDNGKFCCIHRLVVHPQLQGKGIGKMLLQFALEHAIRNGFTSIRLDAYSGNPVALNLYERNGFVRTGEVFFPRRDLPFVCFEKILLR